MRNIALIFILLLTQISSADSVSAPIKERFDLALHLKKTGQIDSAVGVFTEVLAQDSNYYTAALERAKIHFSKDHFTDAYRDFTHYIVRAPKEVHHDDDYVDAYVFRGICFYAMKKYISAISDFTLALKLDPTRTKAYLNRAIAKVEIQHFAGAIRDLDEILMIDSLNLDALKYRAGAKTQISDFGGALLDYTAIIDIDSANAEALYLRGMARILYFHEYNRGIADLTLADEYGDTRAEEGIAQARALKKDREKE